MLQTFEPFRQGDRMLALISTNYTATSVMDLHDGTKLPGSMYWRPADHQWPAGDSASW
jgi:hypothetical protein